ncbi:MAG: bacillithiol biosynthesis cysteine-adding enzyme BshC [Calditrichia bacterium]
METNGTVNRNEPSSTEPECNPTYVITGQQVGLLGGPLYTLYKILTAVRLAEKYHATPVFWMELNDSDFNEINKLTVQTPSGDLETLEWKKHTAGISVGYVQTDESLLSLLNQYIELLPENHVTTMLKDFIFSVYRPGRELQDVAVDLFGTILKGLQVEFFNPMQREFIEFSQSILRNECFRTPVGEQCNAFVLRDRKRIALFRTEDGFTDRNGNPINVEKEVLLPNYRTRPLLQDAWFKNAVYVAGPSEEKYLSELDDLYQHHGIRQSTIVPRFSTTLITEHLNKELNYSNISVQEILENEVSEVFNRLLLRKEGVTPATIKQKAEQIRVKFIEELRELGFTAKDLDYQTKKLLKNEIGAFRADMKQKYQQELALINRAFNFLKPYGNPQERVFPILGMMAMTGDSDFVEHIYQQIESKSKILEMSYA